VQYQRGAITEWYVPSAMGIEQGFTIAKSPAGSQALTLRLRLDGNLPVAASDDQGAVFSTPDGPSLHYDSLRAYDANGVELNVRMTITSDQVSIEVEDTGAAYPITIDPLIYLEAQVIASDGAAGDSFGMSVAVSSDTAIIGVENKTVGSNSHQGAVYIFTRNGTMWSQQVELTASDGTANDYFGVSVAVSGNTAVIGAYNKTVGSNTSQGAAYVFTRSGTTWSQQQKLTASDGAAGIALESLLRSVATQRSSAQTSRPLAPTYPKGRHMSSPAAERCGASNRNSPPPMARHLIDLVSQWRSAGTRRSSAHLGRPLAEAQRTSYPQWNDMEPATGTHCLR